MIMKVVVHGSSKAASRKLRTVIRKVGNPTQANREVSIWLLRWVNQNFKTEGGKVGGWAPFRHGGRVLPSGKIDSTAKLLQDTGRLRASFNPFFSKAIAGIGSDLKYSLTHQLGLPHRNLPARRLVPLASDKDVETGIIKIYDRWITRAIK